MVGTDPSVDQHPGTKTDPAPGEFDRVIASPPAASCPEGATEAKTLKAEARAEPVD